MMGKRRANSAMQAGAVPFRWKNGTPEFCLITSTKRKRWLFPKGAVPDGKRAEDAALMEAGEEAGLTGRIVGEALGAYRCGKSGSTLRVTLFLMEVDRVAKRWEEARQRRRRWVPYEKAVTLLRSEQLRDLLSAAVERLGDGEPFSPAVMG